VAVIGQIAHYAAMICAGTAGALLGDRLMGWWLTR
jgi:hypothetical protein